MSLMFLYAVSGWLIVIALLLFVYGMNVATGMMVGGLWSTRYWVHSFIEVCSLRDQ